MIETVKNQAPRTAARLKRLMINSCLFVCFGATLTACASGDFALTEGSDSAVSKAIVAETEILDPFAANAISDGDWDRVIALLEGKCESDPLKMINLAYAYYQQDRKHDALALYRTVLEGDANPYANRPGSAPLRVKSIAKKAIDLISA